MLPSIMISNKSTSKKAINEQKDASSYEINPNANQTLITQPQFTDNISKISTKKYQIYVIEDAKPPVVFQANQEFAPLPNTVEFSRIVANVITSLQRVIKKLQEKKDQSSQPKNQGNSIMQKWTRYLNLKQNKALVSDCFWYAICKFFKKGEYTNSQQKLQKRIADNYIGLFLSIEDKNQNQEFFKQYFNILSQSVFYSFFYAYPKSRSKFNDTLKEELLSVFSKLFTGIEISNTKKYYQEWRLDLGTGNILKSKTHDKKVEQGQKMSKPSMDDADTMQRSKKRQTLPIRYSPIVELYLKSHKYKTRNYVSQFKMKYSQSNKNQKQLEQKFAHYKAEANKILEWSQAQKEEEELKRQELEAEIKAIKRQTINHHKRLDRRKAQELERGAHQYANYLVSMLNAGITMSSLGVVRRNVGS